jgi:hypothetical protein
MFSSAANAEVPKRVAAEIAQNVKAWNIGFFIENSKNGFRTIICLA